MMNPTADFVAARKLHAQWKTSAHLSEAAKQALIDMARKNRWPVPAAAAGQAKLMGFDISGLVTK